MRKPAIGSVKEYLEKSALYRLGRLPTEGFNRKTAQLSVLAQHNIPQAISTLKEVDQDAIQALRSYGEDFSRLAQALRQTFAAGRRVFLCGCGATGRLSLALESLWRSAGGDNVTGFMAGGDVALVRSVENFEDHPEYGARHLEGLGFQDGDLLLAITEGGETPFVIGAAEAAAKYSRPPFFIFCNPPEALLHVERSRHVLQNPRVNKIAVPVGSMALSGSTRLQASTVLMLGVGLALYSSGRAQAMRAASFESSVAEFLDFFQSCDLNFLERFILAETDAVKSGASLLYETNSYGITILTDTTERSPTFSLRPFENLFDPPETKPALAYLCLPETRSAEEAWKKVLGRLPIGLEWPELQSRLSASVALGFDFSFHTRERRQASTQHSLDFKILQDTGGIFFSLAGREHLLAAEFSSKDQEFFFQHLLLKLALNTHSLLLMGRLGRYEKNVMTWVRPSNGKLIDRSIRYAQYLLEAQGKRPSYEEVAQRIFSVYNAVGDDEPVVLRVVEQFLAE